jgi:tetratricopeptide (TPR) repeat protein
VTSRILDSLQKHLAIAKDDTVKCINLNAMSTMLWQKSEYESSLTYALQARTLSEKLKFPKGIAASYNNSGTVCWYKGDYNKSLEDYFKSLSLMEKINNQAGISDAANNIGMVHYALGNYQKTIEFYKRSLQIDEANGKKAGVALSWNNIGGVYEELGRESGARSEYTQALEYIKDAQECYRKSLRICEEENFKQGLALGYANLGTAIAEEAEIKIALGDTKQLGSLYDASKKFQEKALAVRIEMGDSDGVSGTYINLGELAVLMKDYNVAIDYFNKALKIGKENAAKERILNSYKGLANAKEALGAYAEALRYHRLFSLEQDSIYEEDMTQQIADMQTRYETAKKEEQIKLLDKDKELQSAQIKKQRLIIVFSITGLILVFAFAGVLYNRFLVIKRQKLVIAEQKVLVDKAYSELHEKNKEITDSIYYARRIQRALVTNDRYIQKHLHRLMN